MSPDTPTAGGDRRDSPVFVAPAARPGLDHPSSPTSEQVEAMVAAWHRGERPPAEQFLARHPGLGGEAAIRLIYEEVCLRQEAGLEVDPAGVAARFPEWRAELEVLLDCHRLMQPRPASAAFPEVGDAFGGFRLLAELGRGALGRVFLASQPSLADRPVVLKVTPCGRQEHLSLARLQHNHIVPLYSEQVLAERNLRLLCMPYLGGATLDRVLESLRDVPPTRRTGGQVLAALDQTQAALPAFLPAQGPLRKSLARAPYVDAVCWIGACLADGLRYAHDRGVVHMDIKPSNVLLTGDGQPMLLDFHLAQGPFGPDGPRPPWLGGTPGYVSPEQRAAMTSVGEGRAVRVTVDGRSDVYSLGVLLYEALGGTVPPPGGAFTEPLQRVNPRVSVGLSDVIHKCLHQEPPARYADAAALATDLRRHLNHLPLLGVPNRSPAERWRKWTRRRRPALPRKVLLLAAAAAGLAAPAALSVAYRRRVDEIESALGRGRALLERRQYDEAARTLRGGLVVAAGTPAVEGLRRSLDAEMGLALRDGKAAELHRLADLIRFRYGLAPEPPEEAGALLRRGRAVWEARGVLTRPVDARREPDVEDQVRIDLLDVVTVWADLRVRLAPEREANEARAEALRWLDEAYDLLGPSPSLERLRRDYATALGRPVSRGAAAVAPRSAWEHCDLGRSYLRSGDFDQAADQFQQALDLRPEDFWPNFYLGFAAFRLGRFEDAVAAFRVCIALAPGSGECYVNRAFAHERLGQKSQAIRDFSRALLLTPTLTEAALHRGILYHAEGRHAEAADDLALALATAPGRGVRGLIHYYLARIDLDRGDRASARSHAQASADYDHPEARQLLERLRP